MIDRYLAFIRGVSVNGWGKTGVVLTTSAFFTFIFLEVARLMGIITNAYIGLITYLLFPALFILGLILIPIGWRLYKKQTGKSTRELLDKQFTPESTQKGVFGSRLVLTVVSFTVLNILFMSLASFQMLGFMDESEFCGTACHSVMSPEWTTYQNSPHARVACVECHVGEGVDALISSKLNGTWQMISVTFDLLERPIPTPVHQLRPARETCEKCHWPDKFYGSRLKTIIAYERDRESSPLYTTLNLKVDAGTPGDKKGIHWHIVEENEVRYASVDDQREEMIWVDVRQDDGTFKRYRNKRLSQDSESASETRTLDCVDCHNRATHIYEMPGKAIDKRIRDKKLPRTLPYLKRQALTAITAEYPSAEAASEGIRNHMYGYYRDNYPDLFAGKIDEIDSVIVILNEIYNRNIHHNMNIEWGAYPSHIGHSGNSEGCFRCHTSDLVADDGETIKDDCTLCHSILAYEADDPFEVLRPMDTSDVEYLENKELRDEFMDFFVE